MLSKTIIILAAVAGAVTAQSIPPACQSALENLQSIATEAPTLPPSLLSALAAVTATNPCSPPEYPASVTSALSSYETAALSFYSEHKSEYEALATACPTSLVPQPTLTPTGTATLPADCSSLLASESSALESLTKTTGGGVTGTTAPTPPPSDSGSGSGTSSTSSGGAAPRETGVLAAAAVAAAGVFGVVAVL